MLAQAASRQSSTPPDSLSTTRTSNDDRKRKRDVLSCLDCRRRKLKCDRGLPACARCQKGGLAASCTYRSFPGLSSNPRDDANISPEEDGDVESTPRAAFHLSGSNPPIEGAKGVLGNMILSTPTLLEQANVIKALESRLANLESMVARNSTAGNFRGEGPIHVTPLAPRQKEQGINDNETRFFKGRGMRTQFYGASNPTSLLAHFPEVRAFMKQVHPRSTLHRLENEYRVLFENVSKTPAAPTANLIDLLPERTTADRFVRLYFDTCERTYRILHRPTFWEEYDLFWESPGQAPPGFLPVLLLVMAIVRCMAPNEPLRFDHDGSCARTEAIQWILACDSWLKQQSSKHRFLAMYQVSCLRVLAATANSYKTKEAYVGAEALLNYFKAAGMHRDPSLLGDKCSPYEQEMRRRLWATVMEIEFQASVDRGTPSSLAATPVDCRRPLNVNDDLLTQHSSHLPAPSPSTVYTETSFLDISSKSLLLRTSLCSIINDPNAYMQYGDVLKYEQQIIEALGSIPEWNLDDSTQASTLLDLQLRQFLILLHSPFARRTGSSRYRYSRMVCFETSKHVLDKHSKLMNSNNFAISLLREIDVYRAALSICHNAFLCTLNPADMFFQGVLMNISVILENAFKIFEEGCTRLGRGFHALWYVSAAYGLVQSKLDPAVADTVKLQATDRVAKLYRKLLAFSERPSRPPTVPPRASVPLAENGFNPATNWFYNAGILGFANTESAGLFDSSHPFDSSDWTLDNLWPLEVEYGANSLA